MEPLTLSRMSRPRQAWEVLGGPMSAGLLAGLLLGTTWWLYVAAIAVALIGGLPAGGQHRSTATAAARGVWGGLLWAGTVLVVHALTGAEAALELPEPQAVYLLYGIVPSVVSAVVSHQVLGRRRASAEGAQAAPAA